MKKYLKYDELNDREKNILKDIIKELNDDESKELYESIVSILSNIKSDNAIEIIRKLPQIKPIYKFQTLYLLLEEYSNNNPEITECFEKIKYFIDYEIDVFMLMNLLDF